MTLSSHILCALFARLAVANMQSILQVAAANPVAIWSDGEDEDDEFSLVCYACNIYIPAKCISPKTVSTGTVCDYF